LNLISKFGDKSYQSKTNCTSSYLISTRLGKIGLTFLSSKVAKNIQSGKKYISIQQRVQSCFAKKYYSIIRSLSIYENQIILNLSGSFSCVTITNQSIILKIISFCNEVRIFALCWSIVWSGLIPPLYVLKFRSKRTNIESLTVKISYWKNKDLYTTLTWVPHPTQIT